MGVEEDDRCAPEAMSACRHGLIFSWQRIVRIASSFGSYCVDAQAHCKLPELCMLHGVCRLSFIRLRVACFSFICTRWSAPPDRGSPEDKIIRSANVLFFRSVLAVPILWAVPCRDPGACFGRGHDAHDDAACSSSGGGDASSSGSSSGGPRPIEVFGGNRDMAIVMFLAMLLFLFKKAADYGQYDCTC